MRFPIRISQTMDYGKLGLTLSRGAPHASQKTSSRPLRSATSTCRRQWRTMRKGSCTTMVLSVYLVESTFPRHAPDSKRYAGCTPNRNCVGQAQSHTQYQLRIGPMSYLADSLIAKTVDSADKIRPAFNDVASRLASTMHPPRYTAGTSSATSSSSILTGPVAIAFATRTTLQDHLSPSAHRIKPEQVRQ